jgi:hypothetical protein
MGFRKQSAMMHPAHLPLEELLQDCDFVFQRRGGPGGQHRNKTETAVIVLHRPSGISAEANERRSQKNNREMAIHRLRSALALRIRSEKSDQPLSELWSKRVKAGRLVVDPNHPDFPCLLAEALDRIVITGYHLTEASKILLISPSQIIKLLKLHPPALTQLNDQRKLRGLSRLQ